MRVVVDVAGVDLECHRAVPFVVVSRHDRPVGREAVEVGAEAVQLGVVVAEDARLPRKGEGN